MPATFLKPSPLLRQWGRGAFWDNKVETLGCAVNCQKGQSNLPTYLLSHNLPRQMKMIMIFLSIMISVGELEEAVEILRGGKGSHTCY